jgi:type IV secretion system protein VirB8
MGKFNNLFKKNSLLKNTKEPSNYEGDDLIREVKNWYSDRYESLLVQRNILFLFVIISVASIFSSIFIIGRIASSKTIEPFIVEIEDKTGITNVVNPLSRKDLTTDESLNTYFIVQYIRARETYNEADYKYNHSTVVRLLSAPKVNSEFIYSINSNPKNPINLYGAGNSTSLKLRSLQFLEQGKAQVRFTITENGGNRAVFNKIATLGFEYQQMELTPGERQVNPLGFQIIQYRVDDEIL